ncbi:uncharacterized protein LOC105662516 [Megachile rotundata]|uniref:uncharacterized protein LOC105662516 n=1 Tax=Megachile rotundata TaxID=143995 RepID=UPI003FD3E8D0
MDQELTANDCYQCLQFCNWALSQRDYFFNEVMFTDEATFTKNGSVNSRNMHYWSTENPHWFRQMDNQHRGSVNVWMGVLGDKLIGPYFIEGSLIRPKYAHFLPNSLWTFLDDLPLHTRQIMWIQQDGCPAHYSRIARDTLNRMFPNRWIGRGGPIYFLARSLDLTPLDFFLWGYLKNKVYTEPPTTMANMRDRIISVIK